MLKKARLAVVLMAGTAVVAAVSSSAHAQYGYYGGYGAPPAMSYPVRPGPYANYRSMPYATSPYGEFVTSNVSSLSGFYYGSEYGGPFSGPFRTDSAPLTGGGY